MSSQFGKMFDAAGSALHAGLALQHNRRLK